MAKLGRVKVVSDGTPFGTHILDAETGDKVNFPVTELTVHATRAGVHLTLSVPLVEVDIETDNVTVNIPPNMTALYAVDKEDPIAWINDDTGEIVRVPNA